MLHPLGVQGAFRKLFLDFAEAGEQAQQSFQRSQVLHHLHLVQKVVEIKFAGHHAVHGFGSLLFVNAGGGMLHQPDPSKKPDMLEGIIAIRRLHTRAVQETGFACADEMLYPENYRYLSDILGYVAVGARSVENQQHRLVASGIDVPVGMKNPTGGDLSVMMNSIYAAMGDHTFLYRGWEVETAGNPYAHAIMRGYVNEKGDSRPNYHYEDLMQLHKLYEEKGIKNPACIVDCNHANSGKQYLEQIRIAKEVLHSKRHSNDINALVKGLMIESYIEDGNQKISEGTYGKSITDACLGWEKSEKLVLELADLL